MIWKIYFRCISLVSKHLSCRAAIKRYQKIVKKYEKKYGIKVSEDIWLQVDLWDGVIE